MKKIVSILLITVLLSSFLTLYSTQAFALEYGAATSGKCGDNASWTLSESGVLTISGEGAVKDYYFLSDPSTAIPWYAQSFYIRKVVVKEGITALGENSFYKCSELREVRLPSTLKSIGKLAFCGCKALASVNIPNGVTVIGDSAFSGCGKLTSVDIPDTVESIGFRAFYSSGLTSVTVPESVAEIGNYAFASCQKMTSATLLCLISELPAYMFYQCSLLETVDLPDSVKCGYCAFSGTSLPDNPKITKQPEDITVSAVGDIASISVEAQGVGLTYTWYYKNRNAKSFSRSVKHDPTYSIEMTAERHNRIMYCVVKDRYGRGVSSNYVQLKLSYDPAGSLEPPKITKQPEDITVSALGDTASISVEAQGVGLTYTWYYKNRSANSFARSVKRDPTYSIEMTLDRYGREMYCVVKDKYGRTAISNTVTMRYAVDPIRMTVQPKDTVVANEGDSVKLTLKAKGEMLTYRWYFKNPSSKKWTKSTQTKSSYYTKVLDRRNGRQVYCVITDLYGQQLKSDIVTVSYSNTLAFVKKIAS